MGLGKFAPQKPKANKENFNFLQATVLNSSIVNFQKVISNFVDFFLYS